MSGEPRSRRETKVDLWLPESELEQVRAAAVLAGFLRKAPSERRQQGDVSKLVRSLVLRDEPDAWEDLLRWFRRVGWDMASVADVEEPLRKTEIRLDHAERARVDALAIRAGLVRGGRGNASAFLRALVRHACRL